MNNFEAMQLLAMIKLAYPSSYKDLDANGAKATANMWENSFRDVPYQIMEQAFNSLRMKLKFPPTVAEMAEEIRLLYYEASGQGDLMRQLGNQEAAARYYALSDSISRFKNWPNIEHGYGVQTLIGGEINAGTSGNRLDRAHRLPQLDAGAGG